MTPENEKLLSSVKLPVTGTQCPFSRRHLVGLCMQHPGPPALFQAWKLLEASVLTTLGRPVVTEQHHASKAGCYHHVTHTTTAPCPFSVAAETRYQPPSADETSSAPLSLLPATAAPSRGLRPVHSTPPHTHTPFRWTCAVEFPADSPTHPPTRVLECLS